MIEEDEETGFEYNFHILRRDEPTTRTEWTFARQIIYKLAGEKQNICCGIPLWWVAQNAIPESDSLVLVFRRPLSSMNQADGDSDDGDGDISNTNNDAAVTRRAMAATDEKKDVCCGFACLEFQPARGELYVQLICAQGVGRKTMEVVCMYARRLKFDHVSLGALPYSINFYRKLGFRHNKARDCDCSERKEVAALADEVMEKRFDSNETAENDTHFAKLLKLLIKHNLTKEHNCKTLEQARQDGYMMYYCLHGTTNNNSNGKSNSKIKSTGS